MSIWTMMTCYRGGRGDRRSVERGVDKRHAVVSRCNDLPSDQKSTHPILHPILAQQKPRIINMVAGLPQFSPSTESILRKSFFAARQRWWNRWWWSSVGPDVSINDSYGNLGAITRRRDAIPDLLAFRGFDLGPRLARVRRRPDAPTRDSGGKLGAITRHRDFPPVLHAWLRLALVPCLSLGPCPSRVRRHCRPDVSINCSCGELGAVTRHRNTLPTFSARWRAWRDFWDLIPRVSRIRRRPDPV